MMYETTHATPLLDSSNEITPSARVETNGSAVVPSGSPVVIGSPANRHAPRSSVTVSTHLAPASSGGSSSTSPVYLVPHAKTKSLAPGGSGVLMMTPPFGMSFATSKASSGRVEVVVRTVI